MPGELWRQEGVFLVASHDCKPARARDWWEPCLWLSDLTYFPHYHYRYPTFALQPAGGRRGQGGAAAGRHVC